MGGLSDVDDLLGEGEQVTDEELLVGSVGIGGIEFPPPEPVAPVDREVSSPSISKGEKSLLIDKVWLALNANLAGKKKVPLPEAIHELPLTDIRDWEQVVCEQKWLTNAEQMRKVMVLTLTAMDPSSFEPMREELEEHMPESQVVDLFLAQLTIIKKKPLREKLEKSHRNL